jgi:WD40 repeat protein
MEAEKPVQPMKAPKCSRWSVRRVCVVLFLLFVVVLAALWWLTPAEPYAALTLDEGCGWCVFSPDGSMLVTSATSDERVLLCMQDKVRIPAGPIRVWDVERGHERFSLVKGWKYIDSVWFSPDSGLLAVQERVGELKLWNAKTGEELVSLAPKTQLAGHFQFSPDGRFLVLQERGPDKETITFWNIRSKQAQGTFESDFYSITFAPDGRSIATFCRDELGRVNEVLFWQMDQIPTLVKQHRLTSKAVAFSPDLKTFAAADELPDGTFQIAMRDMLTGEKRWSFIVNELYWLSIVAKGNVLSAGVADDKRLTNLRTMLWNVSSTPKEIGSFSMPVASSSADGEWLAIPLDSGAKLIRATAPERGNDLIAHDVPALRRWRAGLSSRRLRRHLELPLLLGSPTEPGPRAPRRVA